MSIALLSPDWASLCKAMWVGVFLLCLPLLWELGWLRCGRLLLRTEAVCFSCSVELTDFCRTQCTQEDGADTQIPCKNQPETNRPGTQPELTLLSHSACQYQDHSVDAAYSYLRLARLTWEPVTAGRLNLCLGVSNYVFMAVNLS